MAAQAVGRLNTGRRLVFAALALLLAGVGVSWWAPTDRPIYLRITFGDSSVCGTPRTADNGQIQLAALDNRVITIAVAQITGLAVVSACP